MLTRIQKGSSTFAQFQINDSNADIDSISAIMINSNQKDKIAFAPISFESINGIASSILYDITGRISVREYSNKNITQQAFRKMLLNLIDGIDQFDEYMIDSQKVLLNVDSVFINEIDLSVAYICVVTDGIGQNSSIFEFFKSVVESCKVEVSNTDKDYFHFCWNVVHSANGFSTKNLRSVLTIKEAEPVMPVANGEKQNIPAPQPAVSNVTPSGTITVANVVPQNQIYTPPQNDTNKKKKGLGGLFAKKEKNNKGYSGGLAGIREQKTNGVAPTAAVIPNQNAGQGFAPNQIAAPNSSNWLSADNQSKYQTNVINHQDMSVFDNKASNPVNPAGQLTPPSSVNQSFPSNPAGQLTPASSVNQNNEVKAVNPINNPVITPAVKNQPLVNDSLKQPAPEGPKPAVPVPPVAINQAENNKMPYVNSCETMPYDDDNNTTVLQSTAPDLFSARTAYLTRIKTGQKYTIEKNVIQIGRDRHDLDISISDNTNISHYHAKIYVREDGYFIEDLKSKNHTFVNGKLISSASQTRLMNNSKIVFANEEFSFEFHFNA